MFLFFQKIVSLFCFLILFIFVNAKNITKETFIQNDTMEIGKIENIYIHYIIYLHIIIYKLIKII